MLRGLKFNLRLVIFAYNPRHLRCRCYGTVEDSKGAASAALLGDLSKVSGGLTQKSPADPEIEILRSRMVLGQVIHNLNLDIKIKDNRLGLIGKLVSQDKSKLEYHHDAVIYTNQNNSLIVKNLSYLNII